MSLEQCGFCRTDLNAGATVCASCGAQKVLRGQGLDAMAHLGRAIVWFNTIGLLIAGTLVCISLPWTTPAILNGTTDVCLIDIKARWKGPMNFAQLEGKHQKTYRMADQACDKLSAKEIELAQGRILNSLSKPDEYGFTLRSFFSDYYSSPPPGAVFSLAGLPQSRSIPKEGGASVFGKVKATMLSVLAFFVGLFLIRLGNKLWVMIFGRLRDQMWIR